MSSSSIKSSSYSTSSRFITACCGPSVTIWDYNHSIHNVSNENDIDSSSKITFRPFNTISSKSEEQNQRIQDITWNHNGHVIASCTNSPSNNIALSNSHTGALLDSFSIPTHHNKKSSSTKPICTSISFGCKSRYLSLSCVDGAVAIWDLVKKKRVRQFYNNNSNHPTTPTSSPVVKASFLPSDEYVAVLSGSKQDSSLRIFKLRESILQSVHCVSSTNHESSMPSSLSSFGGGSAMASSSLHPNYVAVGMNDGTIILWDVNISSSTASSTSSSISSSTSSLISSIKHRHLQPISDLIFSPTDPQIIASSSLDGSIVFHDLKSHHIIKSIKPNKMNLNQSANFAPFGITCLGIHADGITCAAGTTSGHVLLYDLRKLSQDSSLLMTAELLLEPNKKATENYNSIKTYPVEGLQFQNQISSTLYTQIKNTTSVTKQKAQSQHTINHNNSDAHEKAKTSITTAPSIQTQSNLQQQPQRVHFADPKREQDHLSSITQSFDQNSSIIASKNAMDDRINSFKEKNHDDIANSSSPRTLSFKAENMCCSKDLETTSDQHNMHVSTPPLFTSVSSLSEASELITKSHNNYTNILQNDLTVNSLTSNNVKIERTSNMNGSKDNDTSKNSSSSFHEQFAFLENFQKKSPSPTKRKQSKNEKGFMSPPLDKNSKIQCQFTSGSSSITDNAKYAAKLPSQKDMDKLSSKPFSDNISNTEKKLKSMPQRYMKEHTLKNQQDKLEPTAFTVNTTQSSSSSSINISSQSYTENVALNNETSILHTESKINLSEQDPPSSSFASSQSNSESQQNTNETVHETRDSFIDSTEKAGNQQWNTNGKLLVDKLIVQNMVNEAINNLREDIDNLRDDFDTSLRNLHVDILRQFQSQSDEMNQLFQKQKDTLELLVHENQVLREENERLKKVY